MRTSERMLGVIADDEGVVLKAYRCPAGVLTIGVGHTSSAGTPKVIAGMTITRSQAFDILGNDLAKTFEPRVNRALPAAAQNVFDGAASFDFNTGAIDRASWVGKFKTGALSAAEASFKSWNKGGGKVLAGLTKRRAREADIIFRNRYPATSGTAAAPTATDPPAIWTTPAELAPVWAQLHTLGYTPVGPGAAVARIKAWQAALKVGADGVVGQATLDTAIRAFQSKAGLNVDGKVGPATRAALIRAADVRKDAAVSAGSGAATGTGAGGVQLLDAQAAVTPPDGLAPEALPLDAVASDPVVATVILVALGVALVVFIGLKAWRYRGVITGKRVRT
jgi:lysozyme